MNEKSELLKIFHIGDVAVAMFTDPKIADAPKIEVIKSRLEDLIVGGKTKLIIDFANVEYLSSSGIGALVYLKQKTQRTGGRLCLCNIGTNIERVFRIGNFNKLFDIRDSQEDALESFD